ncbi:MAG: DUF3857 domain-containing protein [Aureispira sp.]
MKLSIIIILLSVTTVLSQDNLLYSTSLIPKELEEHASAIVRLELRKLRIESPSTASLSCRKVVTILDNSSNQNVLYISYDRQSKVRSIRAKLYDAGGNLIRKIRDTEIEDFSAVSDFSIYEEARYKRLEVTHSAYPYTIEFEYSLSIKGISLCQIPNWHIQDYHSAVEKATYQLQLPKDLKIHYQALNVEAEPTVKEVDANTTYTWQLKDLEAKTRETFSPSSSYILPRLLVSLDQFEIEHYKGSFRSWKDFGLFMYQLSEGRDRLSAPMREKVLALTAKASNKREKIEILYQYLQQNMRYVSVQLGIGGWQPFDAAYVEKNKYGDCKALTNFMKAMLKAVDILAYPVLIYSAETPDYSVTETFATSKFNHVILRIPQEDIWLECTSTNFPVNYIGSHNANRTALMITRDGGQLIETPQYATQQNVEHNNIQVYLDENGGASLKGISTLSGSKQEAYRSISNNYPQEEVKKWYQKNSKLSSFKWNEFTFKAAKDTPNFELQVNLSINSYASKTGKRLFVPINKITPLHTALKVYTNRKHPVVIHQGFTEEDQFEFYLPEGYEIESIPKTETKINSPFGSYIFHIKKIKGKIVFKRHFMLNPTEQPADQYPALCNFLKAVAKSDASKMVLVKKN